jgi:general stress protein YciG
MMSHISKNESDRTYKESRKGGRTSFNSDHEQMREMGLSLDDQTSSVFVFVEASQEMMS